MEEILSILEQNQLLGDQQWIGTMQEVGETVDGAKSIGISS